MLTIMNTLGIFLSFLGGLLAQKHSGVKGRETLSKKDDFTLKNPHRSAIKGYVMKLQQNCKSS